MLNECINISTKTSHDQQYDQYTDKTGDSLDPAKGKELTECAHDQQRHNHQTATFDRPGKWADVGNKVIDDVQSRDPFNSIYSLTGDSGNFCTREHLGQHQAGAGLQMRN